MKTLDHNAIARSAALMGFRLGHEVYKARHRHDATRLAEVQQQFQLDISGVAGSGSWVDYDIVFKEVLYYAPTQRANKNEDPQVWWGAVLDSGSAFFSVHVKEWKLDENANYKGATVRVGVMQGAYAGEGGADGSAFRGTIHITFQGLGVPVEDPGYDETP